MLNEAKTSRPRPKLRGRGQDYEVEAEANFWRLRPRPRLKIITKKYQIMIHNIRFNTLLPEKLTEFPNFTRFLPEKCPIT